MGASSEFKINKNNPTVSHALYKYMHTKFYL